MSGCHLTGVGFYQQKFYSGIGVLPHCSLCICLVPGPITYHSPWSLLEMQTCPDTITSVCNPSYSERREKEEIVESFPEKESYYVALASLKHVAILL